MENITLDSLKPNLSFSGDLLIDNSFVVLPHSATVSPELIKALTEWGFKDFICEGNFSLGGDIGVDTNIKQEKNNEENKIAGSIKKAIESSRAKNLGNSDQARMEMVESVYNEYMNYIETLFTYYTTHKTINQEELSDTVQELCIFIKDHRRYMLRINPDAEAVKKNFLVIHTMRSTVLTIAIAMQMHLGLSKIIELGVSCILHEIGMLRLPPQLYMTNKKLTPGERAQITAHSLHGYKIVKDLNFPVQIQLGVLEHHEKENGLGYPQKKLGDKISQNAKIISVACSYEAISSQRSYKDERSTFEAVVELIQNRTRAYDDQIIRALLKTVSLYPIGSYVYLANRKVALVIDVNPDDAKSPVVQLLTEKEKDGSYKIITTNQDDLKIVRILTKNEKNDILLALAEEEVRRALASPAIDKTPAEIIEDEANAGNKVEEAVEEPVTTVKAESSTADSNGIEEVDINSFLV